MGGGQRIKRKQKALIYKGTSVKKFNEIRDLFDIYHIKYSYEIRDSVNDIAEDHLISFLGCQQTMASRAYTGSAGVAGEELKHYYIYADETAMDSIPAEVLERVM